jgi:hypothetical protein
MSLLRHNQIKGCFPVMVAPLEHRDTEPLKAIISSLQDQIEREKEFQESVLWKIRLLERELHYCQRQVTSFSQLLEVPGRIVALEREDQSLDETLLSQQAYIRSVLPTLEDEDLQRMAQVLLADLDRELNLDRVTRRQQTITRILEGYVDTGRRYMEQCQSRAMTLTCRIDRLREELALSKEEKQRGIRMCELSVQFCTDHPDATYRDFRAHVMRLLGMEMEKELKHAIQRIPPS